MSCKKTQYLLPHTFFLIFIHIFFHKQTLIDLSLRENKNRYCAAVRAYIKIKKDPVIYRFDIISNCFYTLPYLFSVINANLRQQR